MMMLLADYYYALLSLERVLFCFLCGWTTEKNTPSTQLLQNQTTKKTHTHPFTRTRLVSNPRSLVANAKHAPLLALACRLCRLSLQVSVCCLRAGQRRLLCVSTRVARRTPSGKAPTWFQESSTNDSREGAGVHKNPPNIFLCPNAKYHTTTTTTTTAIGV